MEERSKHGWLDPIGDPDSQESSTEPLQRQGIIMIFALLRLCIYDASIHLIRLIHSSNSQFSETFTQACVFCLH
jgi:hypothetical protein